MYPDTQQALLDHVRAGQWNGKTAKAFIQLPAGFLDEVSDQQVIVQVYDLGGTEGFLEKLDRFGVDVYGLGRDADRAAEQIRGSLTPGPLYTDQGTLDGVVAETVPHDVPYAHTSIKQNSSVYRVTTRPV